MIQKFQDRFINDYQVENCKKTPNYFIQFPFIYTQEDQKKKRINSLFNIVLKLNEQKKSTTKLLQVFLEKKKQGEKD